MVFHALLQIAKGNSFLIYFKHLSNIFLSYHKFYNIYIFFLFFFSITRCLMTWRISVQFFCVGPSKIIYESAPTLSLFQYVINHSFIYKPEELTIPFMHIQHFISKHGASFSLLSPIHLCLHFTCIVQHSESFKFQKLATWKLPLLGNIHQFLGPLPHQTLANLAN